MTIEDIYRILNELFAELFADDSISLKPETTAADIDGWDSFNHLSIIVAVETRFNIRMQTQEIEALSSIGKLVETIQRKLG